MRASANEPLLCVHTGLAGVLGWCLGWLISCCLGWVLVAIAGQHRWVEYADIHNFDASQIPPEWHGWMTHTFDEPPTAYVRDNPGFVGVRSLAATRV